MLRGHVMSRINQVPRAWPRGKLEQPVDHAKEDIWYESWQLSLGSICPLACDRDGPQKRAVWLLTLQYTFGISRYCSLEAIL
jgi:hypothetical protein